MPLTRFLGDTAFGPDEIATMVAAYEATLLALNLINRADAATEMVARTIVELAKHGERDPIRLRERAVEALSTQPPEAASA
jgi:hypothetical protein